MGTFSLETRYRHHWRWDNGFRSSVFSGEIKVPPGQSRCWNLIQPIVATTPQGAGGVRQQFSVAENIEMSRYSLGFFKNFTDHMADIPDLPDINFTEEGYLFLVTQDGEATLRRNQALQSSFGVKAELMDRDELPASSRQ